VICDKPATRHTNDVTSSLVNVVFGVCCLRRIKALKGALPGEVQWALCEKIMKPGTSQHLGLGIRFKPTIRFGFSVFENFGFPDNAIRSVLQKIKNRHVRFRFFRFGFSVLTEKTEFIQLYSNRHNMTDSNRKITRVHKYIILEFHTYIATHAHHNSQVHKLPPVLQFSSSHIQIT
jgi:hypothetical protein